MIINIVAFNDLTDRPFMTIFTCHGQNWAHRPQNHGGLASDHRNLIHSSPPGWNRQTMGRIRNMIAPLEQHGNENAKFWKVRCEFGCSNQAGCFVTVEKTNNDWWFCSISILFQYGYASKPSNGTLVSLHLKTAGITFHWPGPASLLGALVLLA